MCQERVEAHVHKLEQLLESIKKDKNLVESTNKESGDIEDKMLMDLVRHQQAKQEMESTHKKLSQLKYLINRNWNLVGSDGSDESVDPYAVDHESADDRLEPRHDFPPQF